MAVVRLEMKMFAHRGQLYEAGLLSFIKGEFYRLRKQEGDIEPADKAYEQAIKEPDTPAEAYRELGYLYYKHRDIKENYIFPTTCE